MPGPFLERPTIWRALCLVILYAAIIHAYEPYLVLGLPLVLLGLYTFRSNRLAAFVVAIGAVAAVVSNFWIKKFLLATPFLIGTETRPIAFDVPQILLFFWRGTLNLLGINSGPTYLSLEDFPESPWWIRLVSVAAAVLSIALVLGALASIMASERRQQGVVGSFPAGALRFGDRGVTPVGQHYVPATLFLAGPGAPGFPGLPWLRDSGERDALPQELSTGTHVPDIALHGTRALS